MGAVAVGVALVDLIYDLTHDSPTVEKLIEVMEAMEPKITEFAEHTRMFKERSLICTNRLVDLGISNWGPQHAYEQKGGTCYAHACANVIMQAEGRIVGRVRQTHGEIVGEAISFQAQQPGEEETKGLKGGQTQKVLEHLCAQRRLRTEKVDSAKASAILTGGPNRFPRWLALTFALDKGQWRAWTQHFGREGGAAANPGPLLQLPGRTDGDLEGGRHAVTLVGESSDGMCWKMKNSWGENWGDAGYFLVKKGVLGETMFDVHWLVKDLNQKEIEAFAATQV